MGAGRLDLRCEARTTAKKKDEPKTFSFSWGKGVVEEEAQIATEWHKPTIQLLRYDEGEAQGSYSIRFCHYDHHGRFKRSPLMIQEDDLENLRRALEATPKLRALLSQISK